MNECCKSRGLSSDLHSRLAVVAKSLQPKTRARLRARGHFIEGLFGEIIGPLPTKDHTMQAQARPYVGDPVGALKTSGDLMAMRRKDAKLVDLCLRQHVTHADAIQRARHCSELVNNSMPTCVGRGAAK
jgi:hypothetical protein